MANEEHLQILKQGVKAWNRWRNETQDVKPNLYRANLKSEHLNGIDFSGASLREVTLTWAKLRGAILTGANASAADFSGADLEGADLRDTDLCDTNLSITNLRGVNLRGARLWNVVITGAVRLNGLDLRHADLRNANLHTAKLCDVNLCNANLMTADLTYVDFSRANLTHADLSGANLRKANLTSAHLDHTDLRGAIFHEAEINGTSFNKATLGETTFVDVDLSKTKGLDSCCHRGPSAIDHRTLQKSGQLPLNFIRGCGLRESDIETIQSLFEQSLKHYSCFISYSSIDEDFAKRIHADLQDNGVRCWFAPHRIQAGKKIYEQLDQAIQTHDRLLLILSEDSMSSEWVKTEIAKARQREIDERRRVLFPISLVEFYKIKGWECFDSDTGKDSAREIREYYIPDFSNWHDADSYAKAFSKLLKDLRLSN